MLPERVTQPATGELPLRLRLVHQFSESDTAPQRLVDARAAREQGLLVDPRRTVGVPFAGPRDAAERKLHVDDQVQGAPHDRPHALEEGPILADHPVVQHADGNIRRHVRFGAGVLDLAGDDPHGPGAVRALIAEAPVVCRCRRVQLAAHHECHGALDVVPRVSVLAWRPGDRAVRLLHRGDGRCRLGDLVRVHGTGVHQAVVSGLVRYSTMLLPMSGLRAFSARRVAVL